MSFCYINGQIIEQSHASMPLTNLGIQRGFGIFDLFRARHKRPSFLEDYLDRFDRSQNFLGLSRKISKEEIRQAVDDLQRKNNYDHGTFKLLLYAEGTDTDPVFDPFFYIINTPMDLGYPEAEAGVITQEYVREYPHIKTVHYMTSYMLHKKKVEHDAVDVIYFHNDIVTEASKSNVFVVMDGELVTPERNILLGITRKRVLEMSPIEISIGNITIDELRSADEVFITSTLKELLPITKLDGQPVGNGKIGPITRKMQRYFNEYLQDN